MPLIHRLHLLKVQLQLRLQGVELEISRANRGQASKVSQQASKVSQQASKVSQQASNLDPPRHFLLRKEISKIQPKTT